MQVDFIKADCTKHINPKYFSFSTDLITKKTLEVKKIASADNFANLFIKALPSSIHR